MSSRETNIRSVLFLVIGILLLLSLVICIYIVSSESDLKETQAVVKTIKKDADGTGKNDITVEYEVDGVPYRYNFTYNKEVNEGDSVSIYYHEKNNTSVTTFKTPKIIFVCPLIGLVLCIMGLFELFKKGDDDEDDFKASVIGVVGNTQQLKIVTNDEDVQEYVKTPEEEVEAQVKAIKKDMELLSQNVESIDSTVVKNDNSSNVNEIKLVPEIRVLQDEEDILPAKKDSTDSNGIIAPTSKATVSESASVSSSLMNEIDKVEENELPEMKSDVKDLDVGSLQDNNTKVLEKVKVDEVKKQEEKETEVKEEVKTEIEEKETEGKDLVKEDKVEIKKDEVQENKKENLNNKDNKKDEDKEPVEDKKIEKEESTDIAEEVQEVEKESVDDKAKEKNEVDNKKEKEDLPELTSNKSKKEIKDKAKAEKNEKNEEEKNEEVKKEEKVSTEDELDSEMVKKVKESIKKGESSLDDDEIKAVIKNVLKEVIQEAKEEKEPEKKVEQKRVLPNYYYILGTSLIYEEPGKETKEVSLKTVKSVVRTVNSAGRVVKLTVSNDEVKCILTNMKNIDLESVANLLQTKMKAMDDSFEEVIENKEY